MRRGPCYPCDTTFRSGMRNGPAGPFFVTGVQMVATHEKEKQLTREIAPKVELAMPGTEVLAVELNSPDRFTVYVDHAQGVDHALCERVTSVLREYLRDFSVDVS